MTIFASLTKIRTQQRLCMPFLQSMEDQDIVVAIGTAQEAGKPIIAKSLLLDEIGAPATIRRRLDRLVGLGVVVKHRVEDDGRCFELRLAQGVMKAQSKLQRVIAKLS